MSNLSSRDAVLAAACILTPETRLEFYTAEPCDDPCGCCCNCFRFCKRGVVTKGWFLVAGRSPGTGWTEKTLYVFCPDCLREGVKPLLRKAEQLLSAIEKGETIGPGSLSDPEFVLLRTILQSWYRRGWITVERTDRRNEWQVNLKRPQSVANWLKRLRKFVFQEDRGA